VPASDSLSTQSRNVLCDGSGSSHRLVRETALEHPRFAPFTIPSTRARVLPSRHSLSSKTIQICPISQYSRQLAPVFRAAGLRPTPQRYAVLDFLAKGSVRATAGEIFEAVSRRAPRASRATVYNSLRSLAEAGLVREVASGDRAAPPLYLRILRGA
jgi:DNA-binding transcriptional ArsR family regulator